MNVIMKWLAKLGISSISWGSKGLDIRVALFRIGFGAVLAYFFGELAFTGQGYHRYIETIYLFRYPGLEWIPVLPDHLLMGMIYLGFGTSLLFVVGAFFRYSSILLSATFMYVFLLDISYWNNHYYFYALISVIFVFTNAGNTLSVDKLMAPDKQKANLGWEIWLLRFVVGIVFFYGGISKLSNSEWLSNVSVSSIYSHRFESLGIQLEEGTFQLVTWIISIAGVIFDLLVPFALISKRSRVRIVAFLFYIAFNFMNAVFLKIGTFPYALLGALALYVHRGWLDKLSITVNYQKPKEIESKLRSKVLWAFVVFQLLFPLRHWLIEGNMFWTGEGKLYGWFMMSGTSQILCHDMYLVEHDEDDAQINSHKVDLRNFLAKSQLRTMGRWPFLVPEFARFMKKEAELAGMRNVKVYSDIQASRNMKEPRLIISPTIDLAPLHYSSLRHNEWLLLYAKEGF